MPRPPRRSLSLAPAQGHYTVCQAWITIGRPPPRQSLRWPQVAVQNSASSMARERRRLTWLVLRLRPENEQAASVGTLRGIGSVLPRNHRLANPCTIQPTTQSPMAGTAQSTAKPGLLGLLSMALAMDKAPKAYPAPLRTDPSRDNPIAALIWSPIIASSILKTIRHVVQVGKHLGADLAHQLTNFHRQISGESRAGFRRKKAPTSGARRLDGNRHCRADTTVHRK